MGLEPGEYFKLGEETFEYVGTQSPSGNKQGEKVVGRINPQHRAKEGVLHRLFDPTQLEQEAIKVGPFGEVFPLSEFVHEKRVWESKFPEVGENIPYPPKDLIAALLKGRENGIESMVPHYFPKMRFTRENVFITIHGKEKKYSHPEGWDPLGDYLFRLIESGSLSVDSERIPAQWILVDSTKRPDYDDRKQMYSDDPFKPLLTRLQTEGLISPAQLGSRYSISADQVKEYVLPAIAEQLGTDPQNTRLLSAAEFNTLGNLFHPELGKVTTAEWIREFHNGSQFYIGSTTDNFSGDTEEKGLENMLGWSSHFTDSHIGFRPMVAFPVQSIT